MKWPPAPRTPGSHDVVAELIGEILAELDPEPTVIVMSDHGMYSNGYTPRHAARNV